MFRKSNRFLIVVLIVALIFLGIVAEPAYAGIRIRPLEDWLVNNPRVFYAYVGQPPNDQTFNLLRFTYSTTVPDPSTYEGYIQERDLVDGRVEITVHLTATDFPILALEQFSPDWTTRTTIFEEGGVMKNLSFTMKFILDVPGQEIPILYAIQDRIYSEITGIGNGTFGNEAATLGYIPGALGKVMINQRSLVFAGKMSEYRPPMAIPDMDYFFPVEMINITQLGH